jgi:outer membrane protein OmpA-like peptidoglycan-associated protein
VRKLQDALGKLPATAFKGKTDSRFGAGTAMAYIRYQKTRDKGAADGIVTPADASALGFTLGPSGAQQLGVTDIIGDIARGIFNKWRARPEAGKFALTSDIAEFLHDDTAASQAWTRTTVEFKLKATAPGFDEKDLARGDVARASTKEFKFLLAFEHNGYDIKNAQITRVLQGSSEMKSGQFTADFKAKNATSLLAEVGRIDFNLTGTWDPGLGTKFFSFTGKAFVEADGDFGFALDKNERVSVSMVVGATFSNLKRVPGAKPTTAIRRTVVFFSPAGSSKMSDAEMTKIKAWARRLKDESVRYQRLISGKIVVNVAGHASPTGSGAMNQELSAQRAEKVLKLLKEELGSEAKFRVFKHGEDDPAYKDSKKDENEWDRRVDVWFDVTGVN